MRRVPIVCVWLAACAGSTREAVPFAAESGATKPRVVFAPEGSPAPTYSGATNTVANNAGGTAGAGERTPLSDAVLKRAGSVPEWDSRLAAVAHDLAMVVPEEGTVGYTLVEFALHYHGIVEPTPHLLVVFSSRRDDAALAEAVGARLADHLRDHPYHRIGVGVAPRGARRALVIALQSSYLNLEPVPRRVGAQGEVRLRGRLHPPFAEPEVLVTRENGGVEHIDIRAQPRAGFSARVPCRTDTQLRIEVSGISDAGSSVLANFPVYCGREPPTELETSLVTAARASDATEIENRLVDLVNEERRRAGLSILAVDPEVRAVARAYSREMADTGQVVHISSRSGTPEERLRRAGVKRASVQENLARAASADEAHDSLMNSPGHRANILSELATHIGVGVVVAAANDIVITELFTRIPPRVQLATARRVVAERLRDSLGVRVDASLQEIAQVQAQRLAERGGGKVEEVRGAVDPKRLGFRSVRAVLMVISDLRQFVADKLARVEGESRVGIGVAQGRHPTFGDRAIYVVLLLGAPG